LGGCPWKEPEALRSNREGDKVLMWRHRPNLFGHLGEDLLAGTVTFLIALPLCLGIAHASGAPLEAGIITGIVAGLLVTWLSGGQRSISGPAAGLTVIVAQSLDQLPSYPAFLSALVLAGLFQIIFGILKTGYISAFVPVAVIKGMLAAIGLILILKQIPHALGYDLDYEGDETFSQLDAHTTLTELSYSFSAISPGALLLSVCAIALLIAWRSKWAQRWGLIRTLPGPLVVVAMGVLWNQAFQYLDPRLLIADEHMVNLPLLREPRDFYQQLAFPDFRYWTQGTTVQLALMLAAIASLETLINIEAVDKLDPRRLTTPSNRELIAQGVGNLVAGLIGGLPMTSLVIRSAANINAGAQSRMASFIHGVLLLICVIFMTPVLNQIPLAALATILMVTGAKLCQPTLLIELYHRGPSQWIPFIITLFAVLFTDLLTGVLIGMLGGFYFVVRSNFRTAFTLTQRGSHYLLRLQKNATFLNKGPLREALQSIAPRSYVIIDGTRAQFIDADIKEIIDDFVASGPHRSIEVELKKVPGVDAFLP